MYLRLKFDSGVGPICMIFKSFTLVVLQIWCILVSLIPENIWAGKKFWVKKYAPLRQNCKKKSFNFLPKYQDSSKGRRYNLKTGKFLFNVRNRGWGKKQNENVWNSNSAVTIESCISQKNIINRTADGHGILIRQGVICSGLQQFFVYLRPQDKIIFSWWGGGNFFSFEICNDETK